MSLIDSRQLKTSTIGGTGTMSSQDADNVAITGGSITGITDITVADGGTGASTLADGGLVVGNGTAAVEVVAAGATTEILVGGGASTNPVWTTATGTGAPVRAESPTLVTPTSTIKTNTKTATGDLSVAEVSGTIISNYGQDDDATLTLPEAAAGLSFMVVCGTTVAKYFRIKANTDDKIYLDGVAGADNGYAGIASAAVGAAITFASFQTGAEAYDWIATTLSGTWVAG